MEYILLAIIFISIVIFVIQVLPTQKSTTEEEEIPVKGGLYPLFRPLIEFLAHYNEKLPLHQIKNNYKKKIIKAGKEGELTPDKILAIKEILVIVMPIFGYGLIKLGGFTGYTSLVVLICIGLGFLLPDLWLNDEINKRERAIVKTMPNFLDLLLLSVEAGMDYVSSIKRIVSRVKTNPLIEELRWALRQIDMGERRVVAWRKMAERLDMYEIDSFVTAIVNADETGASMGEVLRIQAEQMRLRRSERAEKLAAQAPVKMLAPLIICIFPAVFLIIFGSLAIQIFQGGGLGF